MTTTVLIGNPRPASRTLAAAQRVVRELTGREPDVTVDLAGYGGALLTGGPDVDAALEQVLGSRLLVVASPTHKGSYTGLLKLFLDRIGGGALAATVAVPVMLGGHWRHALAPETFLKPVLAELGASCPTRGLFLVDSEWDAPGALDGWLPAARDQLASVSTVLSGASASR